MSPSRNGGSYSHLRPFLQFTPDRLGQLVLRRPIVAGPHPAHKPPDSDQQSLDPPAKLPFRSTVRMFSIVGRRVEQALAETRCDPPSGRNQPAWRPSCLANDSIPYWPLEQPKNRPGRRLRREGHALLHSSPDCRPSSAVPRPRARRCGSRALVRGYGSRYHNTVRTGSTAAHSRSGYPRSSRERK
jgi:hypothetical protein